MVDVQPASPGHRQTHLVGPTEAVGNDARIGCAGLTGIALAPQSDELTTAPFPTNPSYDRRRQLCIC